MDGAAPAPAIPNEDPNAAIPNEDIVFINDDDEDLLIEDEWQVDSTTAIDVQTHASQIQLQLRLCLVLTLMLMVLAAMIAIAWQRYGGAIHKASTAAPQPLSRSTSKDKKAR